MGGSHHDLAELGKNTFWGGKSGKLRSQEKLVRKKLVAPFERF